MDKLLKSLGITKQGVLQDNLYTIPIDTYDEFSYIYNKLEQSLELIKDSDNSHFSSGDIIVEYYSDNYILNLQGDLDLDKYELIVQEL